MITIDVYSDVICPWCYIGKRHLEKGIALAGHTATVRRHPFELNPDLPSTGVERREYRVKKFGSGRSNRTLGSADRSPAKASRSRTEASRTARAFGREERKPFRRGHHVNRPGRCLSRTWPGRGKSASGTPNRWRRVANLVKQAQRLTTCALGGPDHSVLYIAHGTAIYSRKLTVLKPK